MTTTILKKSALLASVVNTIASLLMLFVIRHGVDPAIHIEERLVFIRQNTLLWQLSWFTWVLAAVSLIFFFVQWAIWLDDESHGKFKGIIYFGMFVGALGMVPDTIAEILYMSLIPQLALQIDFAASLEVRQSLMSELNRWEPTIAMLTGFLGNGLYCLGGLILNCLMFKLPVVNKKWPLCGCLIWIAGFSLSYFAFVNSAWGLQISTALTMTSFILWTGCLGLFYPNKEA